MPIIRVSTEGEDESEALSNNKSAGVGGVELRELNRVTSNLKLADHLGQFVAGQVASQFQNENLTDMMKGKNMIMVSASWG